MRNPTVSLLCAAALAAAADGRADSGRFGVLVHGADPPAVPAWSWVPLAIVPSVVVYF